MSNTKPRENKNKGVGWIDKKGYRQIKIDGKNKREHRHVVELHLGRALLRSEDVHHIDKNKLNNAIDNLEILPHGKHATLHNNKRVYKKGYKMKSIIRNNYYIV